jgi:hypothetical protein
LPSQRLIEFQNIFTFIGQTKEHMKDKGYKTSTNKEETSFQFESVGAKGTIRKNITYFHLGENIWNLGFGDEDGDGFDDEVISNNHDVRMILQTIANTIYQFTESHPGCGVYIRPVDARRKMLYNTVFKRRHAEIATSFTVFGRNENSMEDFEPKKTMMPFWFTAKKANFENINRSHVIQIRIQQQGSQESSQNNS